MKAFIFTALRVTVSAAAFLIPTLASAQVGTTWVQPTRGVAIALDEFDNVYTVDYEQALGAEMSVTKRDSNGALLWVRSFDQTSTTAWERASWIATDTLGSAIICGTLMSGYSNPVEAASIVTKFDTHGTLLWRRVYESNFDGSSVKKCLVDGSNNIYVLGLGVGPAGLVTKVKKFASDGTPLWSWFDAAGIGAPLNFKITPDQNILITAKGRSGSFLGYAKINLNGNLIWSYPSVNSLTAGDSAGDAFGNTYLVHGEYVANSGTVVRKLNPSGVLIWQRVYPMTGFRIEVGTDNNPVVSGFPNVGTGGAAFLKIDTNGALLWSNPDADGPLGLLAHAHMLLDRDNSAYLAAGTMSEMAVCKVNSDGTSGWTKTVAFGYGQAIALGNTSSSVYVVGGTTARLGQGGAPTLPAAPSGLAYSLLTTTNVDLRWNDNSSNENGFTMERCTGTMLFCAANPGAWSLITSTAPNVTAFRDFGLAPQTTYNWRVEAFNSLGSSGSSNVISATTPSAPAAPLPAPTNLQAQARRTRGSIQVRLSWTDNAATETGYKVERCTGSSCTNFAAIAVLPANAAGHTDTSVTSRATYRYRVAAQSASLKSPYSNIAMVSAP